MKKIFLIGGLLFSGVFAFAQSGKVRNPETMEDKKNKTETPAAGTDMPLGVAKDEAIDNTSKKNKPTINQEAEDISASNYKEISTTTKAVPVKKPIATAKYKKSKLKKKG